MLKTVAVVLLVAVATQAASLRQKRQAITSPSLPKDFCKLKLDARGTMWGYFADPFNCGTYVACQRSTLTGPVYSTKMSCPAGTFWVQEFMGCAFEDQHCLSDPCKDDAIDHIGTYADVNNCAGFYHCDNNRSIRKCCLPGLMWNDTIKGCQYNDNTCTDSCAITAPPTVATTTVAITDKECQIGNYIYSVHSSDATQFKQISADRTTTDIMTCPSAKPTFSLSDCTCVSDPNAPVVAEHCNTFSYTSSFAAPSAWVSSQNEGVELKNGAACFDNGHLEIPYYNNMDWNQALTIEMAIKNEGSGKAFLLTNGDDKNDASISLVLENGKVQALLVAHGQPETCKATVSVNADDTIKMVYDGSLLKLSSDVEQTQAQCLGDIEQVQMPLVVGKSFKGCVDELMICKNVQ